MPVSRTLPPALAAPLNRLALRYAESPLPRFLSWWGKELAALLPERLRGLFAVRASRLALVPGEEGVAVASLGEDGRQALLQLPGAERERYAELLASGLDEQQLRLRRTLLLGHDRVLRRRLLLPAATAENLRAVVGFELDRQTPFRPEQVYYDCRIVERQAGAKQIGVDLVLVPREVLDHALERLGPLSGSLDGADACDHAGQPLGVNLLPAERRVRRVRTRMWLNLGLVAVGLALLWSAAGTVLDNRREAVAKLESEVESSRAEARQVNQLREALDDAAAGANFLAVRREQQPLMLVLLDELTRLLPDDTYLERLSYSDGQVTMTGQSAQAAQLVSLLQDSGHLLSPSLSGVVQPDARTGKDRFSITAGYGPQPEAAEEGE